MYYPKVDNKLLCFDNFNIYDNPLQNLTGIHRDNLEKMLKEFFVFSLEDFNLSPKGIDLIKRSFDMDTHQFNQKELYELYVYYQLTPVEIAKKYFTTHKITEDEHNRLFHEMDKEIQAVLLKDLNQTDPLYSAIKSHIIS
jgi:hypothetical protein